MSFFFLHGVSAVESDCLESGGYRADYIEDLEYKFARWSHDHGTYPSVGRAKAFEQGYGECHGLAGTCRGQECNGVASGFTDAMRFCIALSSVMARREAMFDMMSFSFIGLFSGCVEWSQLKISSSATEISGVSTSWA